MLVLFFAVMMRGTSSKIVFCRRFEAEDDARIDRAADDRQHRHTARHLGRDDRPGSFQSFRAGEVGLGQQHDIGAGDLILEHFRKRRFMIEVFVGRTLGFDRNRIGREAAGRHRLGIRQRDHAVDRDP